MLILNPFSPEAKKIVEKSPPIQELPDEIFALAKNKILGETRGSILRYSNVKNDVLSFHLLFLAVLKFGYHSTEVRILKEIVRTIILERILEGVAGFHDQRSSYGYDRSSVSLLLSQFFDVKVIEELGFFRTIPQRELRMLSSVHGGTKEGQIGYAVRWQHLLALKKPLTIFYIVNGYAMLSLKDLINICSEKLVLLLDEHFQNAAKKMCAIKDERLENLENLISKISAEPKKYLREYTRRVAPLARKMGWGVGAKGGRLKPEFFPPCIRQTIEGTPSGSRNYAITVLLTSFLSYARLAPVGAKKDAKISDFTKDIRVITEEILPMIYQAAEQCSPPLFEDQPHEKSNISYHLGFGLTKEPQLEDSGNSNWYFPPNCEKIRREAPSLCNPDEFCKQIKNPLSYYAKKAFPKGQGEKKLEEKKKVD